LEDGKNVEKLDTAVRSSLNNVHTGKFLKDSRLKYPELRVRQEVASEQNKLTKKDQGTEVTSHNKHQMVLKTFHRDGESCSYTSSSSQKIKDPPVATFSDELQVFDAADISVNTNLPGNNLHAHYDIPRGNLTSIYLVFQLSLIIYIHKHLPHLSSIYICQFFSMV
jgi:hypothetical protein